MPFLLSTFGIVGLISWLTFSNGHQAIVQLSTQLHRKVTEQVQERLHSYLELPYTLNRLNANNLDLEQIDSSQERKIQTQFWKQIQDFPHISNLYVATASGEYFGARRIKNRFAVENATATYMTDESGQPQPALMPKSKLNLRDRPWYQTIVETRQSIWTEVYTDSLTDEPAITAIKPVFKPDGGELEGVLGVSIRLGDINRFLEETKVSQRGQTFIIEPSGKLVAASNLGLSIFDQAINPNAFWRLKVKINLPAQLPNGSNLSLSNMIFANQ